MKITYIPTKDAVVVNRVDNDGTCNHLSTHQENDEVDYPNPRSYDLSQSVTWIICNHCGAYKDQYADDWQGITLMPLGV